MTYTGGPDECSWCWLRRIKIVKHDGECPYQHQAEEESNRVLRELAESTLRLVPPTTLGNKFLRDVAQDYLEKETSEDRR